MAAHAHIGFSVERYAVQGFNGQGRGILLGKNGGPGGGPQRVNSTKNVLSQKSRRNSVERLKSCVNSL